MMYLSLETLPEFDGGSLARLVDMEIRRALLDLQDRPTLAKTRSVSITLEFKPEESEGDLDGITTSAKVKCSIPDKETRTNVLQPTAEGMGFEKDTRRAKFAPDQPTLPHSDE
jgi:hypothetical protein